MNIKALIFDVDGTLADTERDGHRPAFNLSFADAGLDWHWSPELYGELLEVTGGKERIAHYIKQHCPHFTPPDGSPLDEFIAGLHRAKTRHYIELLARGDIPLRPGVARFLGEAREAGLRLAIATTTTPENVTALLRSTLGEASIGWFEVIAAGDVVPAKKPAPDIFIYAMAQLGLPPEACLAVEDSANGLASSRASGLQTLVTVNDYTLDHDFSQACAVLDHLGEPGKPCRVLRGPAGLAPMVTLSGVQTCLQRDVA